MLFSEDDYEDEILEKLVSFFDEHGELVSEETLEQLSIEINNLQASYREE